MPTLKGPGRIIFRLMKRSLWLVLFPLVAFGQPDTQTNFPKDYFSSPLNIPLELSGNFGELRPNHFHTGLDFTTHGMEGLAVLSAADGYVSRIKISPWGYGKAIYVTHPNGFTTVYGHLSKYNDAIGNFIEKKQYIAQTFEIEIFPAPGEFPVRKNEVIAWSGNTGSSGGPHLHFEIRETVSEDALNPLLFGLPVKDNVPPEVVSLLICPATPSDIVNGQNGTKRIPLKKSGTKYVFANVADSITVYGTIGFAIEAFDKETNPTGKNGVYAIRLLRSGKLIYSHKFDRMPFDKSRFINCFIDYKEHERTNRFLMRSFLLPNNQLPVYDSLVNRGYCVFASDSITKFTYSLSDAFGNTTTFDFKVRSLKKQPPYTDVITKPVPFVQVLLWDTTNFFEENSFTFRTPSGAFYQNEIFSVGIISDFGGIPTVRLGDPYIPIQKECNLTLNAAIPAAFQSKALIVKVNTRGGVSPVGGTWAGTGITAGIKEFGTYSIRLDTTAPRITPSNFDLKSKQTDLSALASIKFTITDNLSGIASYNGTIDGKWVLFQYEPKKKTIWYTFDENVGKGSHKLVLVVTDKRGNATTYTKVFTR
jgi:murein DD-endopeptidase MepM/ murein hydrolase activator NlpD